MLPIAARLRLLREVKGMSQGDVEHRTGLLRCYISRVENGHTVPTLETLQRLAEALDVPLYELFYSGEQGPTTRRLKALETLEKLAQEGGKAGTEARFLLKLRPLLLRIPETDQGLFLSFAKGLATR
ncbi:MAG: helix-turn-helix transcriptional regulator [Terriglobia bacterium]|jgi:transcriptional regulator with XRE-family HTH domain